MNKLRIYRDEGGAGAAPAAAPEAAKPAPAEAAKPAATPETPKAKKYDDDEVNALVLKNSSKEIERILRDAGIEPGDNAKENLVAFKKWNDSQKTATELEKSRADAAEKKHADAEKELNETRVENAMLRARVKDDKVERVKKLAMSDAYEGKTPAERVASIIKENPEWADGAPAFGSKTKTETPAGGGFESKLMAKYGVKG